MSIRNYSNTAAQSTLTSNIGATDTAIALAGYAGDPTPPFTAALGRGTASEELVLVTAVIGSTVTVTRGYDGTSAQSQAAGTTFQEVVAALDFREANNHVNATGAVHGTSSQLVGVSDTQTLSNKTLTAPHVSDLTGTGTTTLATVTATTLTVSGASSLTTLTVTGASTLAAVTAGATTLASVTVTGATTVAGLTASGAAALTSATVSATPAAAADVARKDYVDATAAAAGTSAATANTVARRDSSGNIAANEVMLTGQTTAASATRKDYVDGKFTDGGWQNLTFNSPFVAGGNGAKYRVKNGICFYSIDGTRTSAWTAGTVLLTFPVGARPGKPQYVHTVSQSAGVVSSTIGTNGTLSIPAGSANDDVFLSGSYPVD